MTDRTSKNEIDGIVSAINSVLGRSPPYYANEVRVPAEKAKVLVAEIERLRAEVLKLESHIVDIYNAQESAAETSAKPCPVHGDNACLRWYLSGPHAHPSAPDALEWAERELDDAEAAACSVNDVRLSGFPRVRALLASAVKSNEPHSGPAALPGASEPHPPLDSRAAGPDLPDRILKEPQR